jgi:hypothetical protein
MAIGWPAIGSNRAQKDVIPQPGARECVAVETRQGRGRFSVELSQPPTGLNGSFTPGTQKASGICLTF